MSESQIPIERRMHRRFKVRDDIFAVLGKNSHALGRIIDISKGGLSFTHNGGKVENSRMSELSLLFADRNAVHISHTSLKFRSRIVSDNETVQNGNLHSSRRRCAVQFDDLTWYQQSSLDNLISLQSVNLV